MITEESRLKYSAASKARQAKIPPEVRKAWMIHAAKMRWATKTPEQRREHALKMVKAKKMTLSSETVVETK